MNIRELASLLAKREGGKSEAKIGDVRELLRVFADLALELDKTVFDTLADYAAKRANRKKAQLAQRKRV